MTITSLKTPFHAVVVGAGGGIGAAFVRALLEDDGAATVTAFARRPLEMTDERLRSGLLDLTDEVSVRDAAAFVADKPRLVIVATGLLHDQEGMAPEKSWRDLDPARLQKSFAVNAIGPALVMKHFLPLLPRTEKSVFVAVSARVGSIGDNRLGGWYGYRASKAALNMMLRTASIELARRWPEVVCAGLHPGTVDTSLSRPFQGNVPDGKLFSAKISVGHMLRVIDGLTPAQSGLVFDWDGREVPP